MIEEEAVDDVADADDDCQDEEFREECQEKYGDAKANDAKDYLGDGDILHEWSMAKKL